MLTGHYTGCAIRDCVNPEHSGCAPFVPLPPRDSFATLNWSDDPFALELLALYGLHDAKRHDYTGGGHRLANYQQAAAAMGVPTRVGMLGRLAEKVFRLKSLYANGDLPRDSETLEDTYRDIAVIAILSILNLRKGSGYDD